LSVVFLENQVMQHPFAGIVDCDPRHESPDDATVGANGEDVRPSGSRRSFLERALAAAAGMLGAGFLAGRSAAAQYTVIRPRGQESSISHWPRHQYGAHRPTTYALGEEGSGYYPPPPRQRFTTYALGEEGTYRPWRPRPGYGYYRPAPVTTYALGEEGSGGYWRW
jgi:hypothetical protein